MRTPHASWSFISGFAGFPETSFNHTVEEIRRSPVEVAGLSHYLQFFSPKVSGTQNGGILNLIFGYFGGGETSLT